MRASFLVCTAAVLLCSGCNIPDNLGYLSKKIFPKNTTPLLTPVHIKIDRLCTFDGVSVSPNGGFAVLDQDLMRATSLVGASKDLAVVDLRCLNNGVSTSISTCITALGGLVGIRPLAWSADEKSLFAIENEESLVRYDFSGAHEGKTVTVAERVPVDSEIAKTVVAVGVASANNVGSELVALKSRRLSALQGAKPVDIPLAVYVDAKKGLGAILFAIPSLGLSMLADGVNVALPLKKNEVHRARIAFEEGHATLVDTGIGLSDKGEATQPPSQQAFSKPIVSSVNAALLGRFGRHEIIELQPSDYFSEMRQDITARLLTDKAFFIQNISTNDAGSYSYILKDVHGNRRFGFSRNGKKFQYDCARSLLPGNRGNSIHGAEISLGTKEWPLSAIRISGPEAKGLAVIFGGGPGGSGILRLEAFTPVRSFLQLGWDVLVVGYSSTIGTGIAVSSRFRMVGPPAIERDMQLVADYLQNDANFLEFSKKNTVVYGESFGALPAVALSGHLPRKHRLILVAPFLLHQDPADWLPKIKSSRLFSQPSVAVQREFEHVALGPASADQETFQAALDRIYRLRADTTPTFIVYAREDPLFQPEHVPSFWKDEIKIFPVPGDHRFVSTQSGLWTAIETWLDGR